MTAFNAWGTKRTRVADVGQGPRSVCGSAAVSLLGKQTNIEGRLFEVAQSFLFRGRDETSPGAWL